MPSGSRRISQLSRPSVAHLSVLRHLSRTHHDISSTWKCHQCGIGWTTTKNRHGFCDKHHKFDLDHCHNQRRGKGKYHWKVSKTPYYFKYYKDSRRCTHRKGGHGAALSTRKLQTQAAHTLELRSKG